MAGIHIAAVGPGVRLDLLDNLAARLAARLELSCRVHPRPLDAGAAFDERRGQYWSTRLLRDLAEAYSGYAVLGVAACDLFVPVLTFVFGEAQLAGSAALVSYCRLREEFYGLPANERLLIERLFKESLHEIGHTRGLRHCDDWNCVMTTSHAPEVLDIKGADFCPACWARMEKGKGRGED